MINAYSISFVYFQTLRLHLTLTTFLHGKQFIFKIMLPVFRKFKVCSKIVQLIRKIGIRTSTCYPCTNLTSFSEGGQTAQPRLWSLKGRQHFKSLSIIHTLVWYITSRPESKRIPGCTRKIQWGLHQGVKGRQHSEHQKIISEEPFHTVGGAAKQGSPWEISRKVSQNMESRATIDIAISLLSTLLKELNIACYGDSCIPIFIAEFTTGNP